MCLNYADAAADGNGMNADAAQVEAAAAEAEADLCRQLLTQHFLMRRMILSTSISARLFSGVC